MLREWWQSGRTDWFSNLFNKVRYKVSKKKEAKEEKVEKEVQELARGKVIRFKSPWKVLFSIRQMNLSGGKIVLNDRGTQIPPFEDIHVRLKNLRIFESGKITFDVLHMQGKLLAERKGSFDIEIKSHKDRVTANADLKDINLKVIKPIYQDSSPVLFNRGFLDLDSHSTLSSEELQSDNRLKINDYEMTLRNQWNIGRFSTQSIIDALNRRQSFEVDFKITGTPEKPSFSGFKESLIEVVKDDLKDQVTTGLKEKAGEQLGKLTEKLQGLF